MCVTQFILTPTACTHITNYGLLKQLLFVNIFDLKIIAKRREALIDLKKIDYRYFLCPLFIMGLFIQKLFRFVVIFFYEIINMYYLTYTCTCSRKTQHINKDI